MPGIIWLAIGILVGFTLEQIIAFLFALQSTSRHRREAPRKLKLQEILDEALGRQRP